MMKGQTMKSIIERLRKLEQVVPAEMRLLCTIDGEEKELTLNEYKATPNAHWQKVLGGGTLVDVDFLLREIEEMAHEIASNSKQN